MTKEFTVNTHVLKNYISLTKPGIIYGNSLTALGGFLLASALADRFDPVLMISTLVGIALVIASACVFNNYLDRGIDQKMSRTKHRALAEGRIPIRGALAFAGLLGVAGFWLLAMYTNLLTVVIGLVGFVDYLALYGLAKRRTVQGTIVGSIAGATPVVAGYTAVINSFDTGASILFLILVFWQMPHFYAIALFRSKDYAAANIPVLPLKQGARVTKVEMLLYIGAFIAATSALTVFGYTGYTFAIVMLVFGLIWLRRGLAGLSTTDDHRWARRMFGWSLIVICALSIMLAIGALLP